MSSLKRYNNIPERYIIIPFWMLPPFKRSGINSFTICTGKAASKKSSIFGASIKRIIVHCQLPKKQISISACQGITQQPVDF
jgi:hypothetical protein